MGADYGVFLGQRVDRLLMTYCHELPTGALTEHFNGATGPPPSRGTAPDQATCGAAGT